MDHTSSESAPEAITAVLVAHHRAFLEFLEARVGNRHDAEEILQSAFVRSVERAGDIREAESAVAWFYRVLRNAVVDHHRRSSSGRRTLDAFAREMAEQGVEPDPAMRQVVCRCIAGLLPTLRPEDASLVSRVDLDGEEVGAVAESLGIEPGTARVRLHRARAALRERVERTCRTCAAHGCFDCSCGEGGAACGGESGAIARRSR